jgi:hypothetical protein
MLSSLSQLAKRLSASVGDEKGDEAAEGAADASAKGDDTTEQDPVGDDPATIAGEVEGAAVAARDPEGDVKGPSTGGVSEGEESGKVETSDSKLETGPAAKKRRTSSRVMGSTSTSDGEAVMDDKESLEAGEAEEVAGEVDGNGLGDIPGAPEPVASVENAYKSDGDAVLQDKESEKGETEEAAGEVEANGKGPDDAQPATASVENVSQRKSSRISKKEVTDLKLEDEALASSGGNNEIDSASASRYPRRNRTSREVMEQVTSSTAVVPKKASAAPRAKRKAEEMEQDTTAKPEPVESSRELPGKGWSRGTFTIKGRPRKSWISPTWKIQFKYRTDAVTFEELRKKHKKDEIKAWMEYTTMKHAQRKIRDVIDPYQVDKEMGVNSQLLKNENTATTQIGPGWQVDKKHRGAKLRIRFISPTRNMSFR